MPLVRAPQLTGHLARQDNGPSTADHPAMDGIGPYDAAMQGGAPWSAMVCHD